jgi:NAD(P)-dependent dehydrogenase (short-subunit alcohol dehydrogenase family)
MASKHIGKMSVYSASKDAIRALSQGLAVEYAPYGIRVNCLCPGYIKTALTSRVGANPLLTKFLLNRTPLRRAGTPQDVANAALFLASDEAAYVTGASLAVDGGMSVML